eukprot:GHUV01050501.1.p2 GENE.GHUV01050501.1~~GHUV01050501.1.p2  ORF type:complete len:196 (+),score=62.87 GHUV01050501.1:746-1333(+)
MAIENPREATSTTKAEFQDNMVNVARIAEQHWADTRYKPLFVFDNNSIQKYSSNFESNIKWHQRVGIPAHSPDFSKPIEHIFNRIKEQLREKYLEKMEVVAAQKVQEWVRTIFEKELLFKELANSVRHDVYSLKKTWLAVSTTKGLRVRAADGLLVRGSGGDWPAGYLRPSMYHGMLSQEPMGRCEYLTALCIKK